jgi:poly-gamma-glutamate capsule biosynthesis protein CapA/YwtB (metallophosphatase superfamily)
VKTREANFRFPVLGFTPDREIWGFGDINTLTSCGPRTLKDNMQADMELVDADGRHWIVRSVRRVGRARPLVPWLLSALLTSAPQSRIEHELEELEIVTLTEVQARVCASLRAFPQDFGAVDERDPVLEERIAQVSNAQTIAAIHNVVGLDSFKAY